MATLAKLDLHPGIEPRLSVWKLIIAAQSSVAARYSHSLRSFHTRVQAPPGSAVAGAFISTEAARLGRSSLLNLAVWRALEVAESDRHLPAEQRRYVQLVRQTVSLFSAISDQFVEQENDLVFSAQLCLGQAMRDPESRFGELLPDVQRILDLTRRKADLLAAVYPELSPYDRLMALWGGGSSQEITTLTEPVIQEIPKLRDLARSNAPGWRRLDLPLPVDAQRAIGRQLLSDQGFDFNRGGLVFCQRGKCWRIGPDEVWIGAEIFPDDLVRLIFSILHEGGHSVYFQSCPSWYGQGLAHDLIEDFRVMELWPAVFTGCLPLTRQFWDYMHQAHLRGCISADITPEVLWCNYNHLAFSSEWKQGDNARMMGCMISQTELEELLISGQLRVTEIADWYQERLRRLFGSTAQSIEDHLYHFHPLWQGTYGLVPMYLYAELGAAAIWERLFSADAGLLATIGQGHLDAVGQRLNQHFMPGFLTGFMELITGVLGESLTAAAWIRSAMQRAAITSD